MKAERALDLVRLARRLGWTLQDVKAMTGHELRAVLSVLQDEELSRKRAEAQAKSRRR